MEIGCCIQLTKRNDSTFYLWKLLFRNCFHIQSEYKQNVNIIKLQQEQGAATYNKKVVDNNNNQTHITMKPNATTHAQNFMLANNCHNINLAFVKRDLF